MNNIEIRVDKRIELACVLLLLSNDKNYYLRKGGLNKKYFQSVQNHFKKFSEEETIKIIQNAILPLKQQHKNIGYILFDLMLRLDENLEVNQEFEGLGEVVSNFWDELKKELPNFIKHSKFKDFYNSNMPFYKTLIDNAKKDVDTNKINQFMHNFYGKMYDDEQLRIIDLCPLVEPCTSAKTKDGSPVCICSLDESEKGLKFIGATAKTSSSAVHEFSHPIVNTIVFGNNPISTDFYNDILDKVRKTIGNNETYGLTIELTVRAIQIVYLKHMYPDKPEWAEWKHNHNKQVIGFGDLFDLFVDKLESFYKNTSKDKDFKTYLPEMLAEIKNTRNITNVKL